MTSNPMLIVVAIIRTGFRMRITASLYHADRRYFHYETAARGRCLDVQPRYILVLIQVIFWWVARFFIRKRAITKNLN